MKKVRYFFLALGAAVLGVLVAFGAAACGNGKREISLPAPSTGEVLVIVDGMPEAALGKVGDICLTRDGGTLWRKATETSWERVSYREYRFEGDALVVTFSDDTVGRYVMAAASEEGGCDHANLGELYTVYPAYCVVPGIGVRTCTDCGESFAEVIPANGTDHLYSHAQCAFCGAESAEPYTVSYELGDHAAGSEAPAAERYDVSETLALAEAPAAESGYAFSSWKVLGERFKAGSDVAIKDLVQYAAGEAITFTATWTETLDPDAEVLHVAGDEVDLNEDPYWGEAFKQELQANLEFENVENETVKVDPSAYAFTLSYIENGTIYYGDADEGEVGGLEKGDTTQPVVGSTYIAHGTLSLATSARGRYALRAADTGEYAFEAEVELLVRVRTVQIGVRDPNNNNVWHSTSDWTKWYTIEEALHEANAIGGSYETVIYLNGGENTVRTEFSRLDPAVTGYTDSSYFTVKDGVTLLLPVAAVDAEYAYTSGTNQTYKGAVTGFNATPAQGTRAALPEAYNKAANPFSELVIPAGVTLTVAEGGTLTVGAVTGAAVETSSDQARCVRLNEISANWSHLILEGTIESYGTVEAYGDITGNGTIEAYKDSTVLERFEALDWPNTKSAIGRYVGNQNVSPGQVIGDGNGLTTLGVDNPNEFPLENYRLVAISAVLRVHSGATYMGDVRVDTASERFNNTGTSFFANQQFIVSQITIAGPYKGGAEDEGIFLLKDGTVLTKTADPEAGRFSIEIDGDAVGGVVNLALQIYFATFVATSKTVKLPVSACLDIVVKNGTFESEHGYEFMGTTELDNYVGRPTGTTTLLSGSTLTLKEGANVILENADDGIIFYEGAKLTVGAGCSLEVGGKFGGEISGERGAKITLREGTTSASGYIGGTGNVWANRSSLQVEVSFEGDLITRAATGALAGGSELTAGMSYYHDGTKWIAGDTQFSVTYKYYYRGEDGALHEAEATDGSGNPTFVTPDQAFMLSSQGLTYADGYKFTGWYADEACTESIYAIDGLDLTDHTAYGLFEQVNVYNFEFNTNYNTLSGNAVETSDSSSGIEINPVPVSESKLNAFSYDGGIRAQDGDAQKPLYFLGWYFEHDGAWTAYSAEALQNAYGSLSEDVTVTLYAVWAQKVHVTFADAAVEYTYDAGYYMAGSSVSPVGYDNKNSDVTVFTYFVGWTAGDEALSAGSYTVPETAENGTTIALTASRNAKVHVTFTDGDYSFDGYYMAGTIAKPDGYENGNNDSAILTYFAEWVIGGDDSTEYVEGYPIPARTADGAEVSLTALRKNKIRATFTDTVAKFNAEGYYVPGNIIQFDNYVSGNDDLNVSTYFVGWMMNGDTENLLEFIPSDYEGDTLEITAYRKNKVAVTIERDSSAKEYWGNSKSIYSIAAEGVKSNGEAFSWIKTDEASQAKTVDKMVAYFMEGTSVTITIEYILVDNSGLANDGYKDVWYEVTIGGVAEGRVNLPTSQTKASREFVLEEGKDVEFKCGGTLDKATGGIVCLVEGTLVTLADGTQKKVEDLAQGDMLLAFNHFTGKYEASPLAVNIHAADPAMNCRVIYLTFSDGTKIGVITEHAFFDLDENEYVFIGEENAANYIGHRFVKVQSVGGEFVNGEVTLTGFEVKEEFVRRYSPVSGLFNVVTEGLLSFTEVINGEEFVHGAANIFEYGEGLKYNEEKMQADIETYGLYTYEDFADYMTEEEFEAGPWKYYKVAVGKGLVTWYDIIWNIQFFHSEWEAQGWN